MQINNKIIKKLYIAVPLACFTAIGLMLLSSWLTNYFYWLETGKMYANQVLK